MLASFLRPSSDAPLLENAPPPGRALREAGLLLVAVFLPSTAANGWGAIGLWLATAVLAVWGLALLVTGPRVRRGLGALGWGAMLGLLLLAVAGTVSSSAFGAGLEPPPRLGARVEAAGAGTVEVTKVLPGLPAEGVLQVEDRVVSISDTPLPAENPDQAFLRRIREAGDGKQTELRLGVLRRGEHQQLELKLPAARKGGPFAPGAMTWICIRALGVSLLVALLVWSDGQGPRQLGLVREGVGRELLLGGPALVGAYVAHLTATIPLALLAALLQLAKDEALVRKELAASLAGSGLSIPAFAAAMVVVASFEELAFRAFLVPRLQRVLRRWWLAVVVAAVLFGAGHLYEGTLAVAQTAVLGAYFGFVFVLRFRLASVMVAHALFNTVNFALMVWLQRSGLLERMSESLPK